MSRHRLVKTWFSSFKSDDRYTELSPVTATASPGGERAHLKIMPVFVNTGRGVAKVVQGRPNRCLRLSVIIFILGVVAEDGTKR